MALFRANVRIDAPPERVWDVLADWEATTLWMVDTTTVEVLSEHREGIGTRVRAVTRIAGIALVDVMTVSRWEPRRLIVVRHERWPILGIAWFEITPDGTATVMEWAEELDPPLGPLGELGARILRRPIEAVLRRSLIKLGRLVEWREGRSPRRPPNP